MVQRQTGQPEPPGNPGQEKVVIGQGHIRLEPVDNFPQPAANGPTLPQYQKHFDRQWPGPSTLCCRTTVTRQGDSST